VERITNVDRALLPKVSDLRFKVELDAIQSLEYKEFSLEEGLRGALVPSTELCYER
jgi:hypothetical protein